MGLFDLFRRRPAEPVEPDHLRELLFGAAAAGDARGLRRLCRDHRDVIVRHFPDWQKVPEPLREDRPALERYFQGLVAVAQTFADGLRDPSLMQLLTGPPGANPLVQWEEKLQQARGRMDELDYHGAAGLLCDLLIDVRKLKGSGVDHHLPVTLGHLGECYFQQADADRAVPHLEQALRLCEQSGDAGGVAAYLNNLYEVHRYAGRPAPAADHAERLAATLAAGGDAHQAARYRRQAEIVRAGEPLNRIIAVLDDRPYELDEVPARQDLHVRFVFQRNRPSLRPAQVHAERGNQLAGEGNFDDALGAFRAAAQADPYDPHPPYLAGDALLHLRRYAEAVESYEAAEERAPGWFRCRADLGLARQLLLGRAGHEVFLAVRALEDGKEPPKERVRLAERALAAAPGVALLHLLHGKNLAALGRRGEAAAAYRSGLDRADEASVRTRLLVELGVLLEDARERSALLREARDLNGDLVAGASAHVALLCYGARGEG